MISASIENTLLIANNLTATNDWAIQGLSAGPCGNFIEPIGLGILKGDYGPNNVTSAGRPLSVWAEISCPADYAFNGTSMYDLYNITSYLLPPGTESNPNYNATYAGYYMVSTPQPPPICDNGTCVYTSTPPTYAKGVFTTWMSDQATIYAAEGGMFTDSLHSSLPGNYTVVAGDEWGQIQILHFQVVPSNKLPSVGTFLTWGGCAEASNGTAYAETCEAQELSSAHVFNCASEAATTNGCSATITGVGVFPWQPSPGSSQTELPIQNNTITVWYPFTGGTAQPAGTNCYYQIAHGYPGTHYASCLMVNATAFVIGT